MSSILRAAAFASLCCLGLSGCLAAAAGAGAGAGFVAADNASAKKEEKATDRNRAGTSGSTMSSAVATAGTPDRMSVDRMIGQEVQSAEGQRIGDIKDIVLDRDGRARDAIIGASGGDIAIPLDGLRRSAAASDRWVAVNVGAEQARLMARYSYDRDSVSLQRR
jgi:hypothetical protein